MALRNISDEFIKREQTFLTRPDGIQLTGIEAPQIIAPFKPVNDSIVPVLPSKPTQFYSDVKALLNRVDDSVKNTAKGVEVSVKRLLGAVDDGSKTASSISTAPSVAFVDASQPIAKRVTFSPFKIRIWSKDNDRDDSPNGGKSILATKTIPVGRYIFTLKTPYAFSDIAEMDTEIPFQISGKHAVLEKVAYDKESATMRVQIRIVQNFVLVTLAIASALTAGGYFLVSAGDAMKSTLESVDKVLDTTIVGAVVVGGGYLIAKRMGYL